MRKTHKGNTNLLIIAIIALALSVMAFVIAMSEEGTADKSPFDSQFYKASTISTNVSFRVTGGTLFFSRAPSPSLGNVVASLDNQTTSGTLGAIEVTDLRGSAGVGWAVNVDSITNYNGDTSSTSIPLTNTAFAVSGLSTSFGDNRFVSGITEPVAPIDADRDGVSDRAITLVHTSGTLGADRYNGINKVSFSTGIGLTVPGGSPADTYTSVYTISVL